MPTVGEILRNERERQGLELKDIENAISIRELYLSAIEEGNYNVVPGEVYLKGFIRNYAIELGLDPQEVLNVYYQDREGLYDAQAQKGVEENSQGLNFEPSQAKPPNGPTLQIDRNQSGQSSFQTRRIERERKKERRKKSSAGSFFKRAAILVVGILIVGTAAWWALDKPEPAPAPSPAAQKEAAKEAAPPPAEQPILPPSQPSAVPEPNTADPGKAVAVTAKFNNSCWIQVNIDGKLEYEGIPKIGETLTFNGAQKVFIKFGNAGAAELTHNGKVLGVAGAPGDVVIKTFDKNAVSTVNLR